MSASQLKAMSVSQWKLLSQLRDYLTRASESGLNFTVTKEWASLLQKLPSVSQAEQREKRSDQSPAVSNGSRPVPEPVPSNNNEPTKSSNPPTPVDPAALIGHVEALPTYTQQVIAGLMLKFNGNGNSNKNTGEVTRQEKSKWKSPQETVSKHTISSKTRHGIAAIDTASNSESLMRRLDNLLHHLYQFPDARIYASQEGAVKVLLRIRSASKDEAILGVTQEILALLGYVDPLRSRGIRILSIDGGGIRGVLVIEMLKKLEELTGEPVYNLFDYICGVSTGAILSCVLAHRKISLDQVSVHYKDLSTKIFTQSAFRGTRNLVFSHAYYDTSMWEEMLRTHIGDQKFIHTARNPNCPKFSALSTVVNQNGVSAFVFRNYELKHGIQSQYMGSSQYALWQAVRASSSAPTYFEEYMLGDLLHQDGGILVNNPTAVAIHEAQLLWPGVPLQCVVSFGTGRCNPATMKCDPLVTKASSSSWMTKFSKILESATDTEAVHTLLNDLMPGNVYYRFNPYLTESIPMAEIRPEKIEQMELDAQMYYRRNEEKFKEAAVHLMLKRTPIQKASDWMTLQARKLGVRGLH